VEEIAIKKPRTMADLLAVVDVCIEASEARTQLLESCDKGPSKKKQDDREVNTADRGDHKGRGDRRYRGNRQQQSSDQKEKRSFHHLDDVEKWCEIYRTSGHDLEECKKFLDREKMPPLATLMAQEPHWGEHRRANPTTADEQMGEINMIFGGSMPIALKT
jgi:hypothetical protein